MAKNINKDVVYKAAKSKEKDYMLNDGAVKANQIKSTT